MLVFEPLRAEHLPALAEVLRHEEVYRYIEPAVPPYEEFVESLTRGLRGPPPGASRQYWLHYLVSDSISGERVGRLEANITLGRREKGERRRKGGGAALGWGSISTAATDDFCEIAVVLSPRWWGQGMGSAALAWLHSTVHADHGINLFYATTHPQNARCQRLLIRNGYSEIHSTERRLLSYEAGDLIFRYSMEENNEPDKTMARSV
jgi:RimJ/RimL family protein N-acetyltransferase